MNHLMIVCQLCQEAENPKNQKELADFFKRHKRCDKRQPKTIYEVIVTPDRGGEQ